MLPLTDVIYQAENSYLRYLGRKTGFVPSGKNELEMAQYIWLHIIRRYNFSLQYSSLNEQEKKALHLLLANFCALDAGNEQFKNELVALEQKIPWVFARPSGGYFIPLEVIKKLMAEPELKKENFLFCLLHRLGLDELNGLATLAGQELEAQASISFESHVLDMALVLYIWYASVLKKNYRRFLRGRVLASPFASSLVQKTKGNNLYPNSVVNLWSHLSANFSDETRDIERLRELIIGGNKEFYRALALLPDSTSRFYQLFKNGMLVAVLPKKKKKSVPLRAEAIEVVTPVEVVTLLQGDQPISSVK